MSFPIVEHYFAYGSNMNPQRVGERGLEFDEVRPGRLANRRLVFDKLSRNHPHVAHANIVHAPGEFVEGVLYRLRPPDEILKMDPFERTPVYYGRDVVQVASEGQRISAWTYFANRALRREGLRPQRAYLEHLLAGRPYLSPEYYRWLQGQECAD